MSLDQNRSIHVVIIVQQVLNKIRQFPLLSNSAIRLGRPILRTLGSSKNPRVHIYQLPVSLDSLEEVRQHRLRGFGHLAPRPVHKRVSRLPSSLRKARDWTPSTFDSHLGSSDPSRDLSWRLEAGAVVNSDDGYSAPHGRDPSPRISRPSGYHV